MQEHALIGLADAEAAQTSTLLMPWTSRKVTTSLCRGGSSSMAARIRAAIFAATSRSSTWSAQGSGGTPQVPAASNLAASTTGSMSCTGTLRRSRAAALTARLITMRMSQVRNVERCSKLPMPRSTPTQASWTTSSATARLGA